MGDEPEPLSPFICGVRDRSDQKGREKIRVKKAAGTLRWGFFEGMMQGQGQSRRDMHADPVPHPYFPGGGATLGAKKERKEQVTEERWWGGNHGSLCQWPPKSSPLWSLTLTFAMLD